MAEVEHHRIISSASTAAEDARQVKSGAGRLFSFVVSNTSGSDLYVYFFDNTASSGTAFVLPPIKVAAGGFVSGDNLYGLPFSTGCRIAASSTHATFAAAATSALMIAARYF